MRENKLSRSVRRLPKAELHLHLEGSITPEILLRLARKYRTELARLSKAEIVDKVFTHGDFNGFLENYRVVCDHLRQPRDYQALLYHLRDYCQQHTIRYAEVIYSPAIPWKLERDGELILRRLLNLSKRIGEGGEVQFRWILDCVRQFGPESAERTVRLAAKYREHGVVGVGLGGDELSVPISDFAAIFTWAQAHQLYVHVHAGEIAGPEQVWEAVKVLGANRVGHGIQAARDAQLMEYLREHAIGLDVCLTSNLKTRAWAPLSQHPFKLLYSRGVPTTLNTDDPGLFRTTLTQEYLAAIKHFDLSEADLKQLALRAVILSFLDREEKKALMERFFKDSRELSDGGA